MKLVIGSDHGGYQLKEVIKLLLLDLSVEFEDYGVHSEASVNYPLVAEQVSLAVAQGKFARGILVCGTGIGVSIAANKVKGIRAALCGDVFSAVMSREHNDANVLCLGQRVIGCGLAEMIVKVWLETEFTAGRHARRVELLGKLDAGR